MAEKTQKILMYLMSSDQTTTGQHIKSNVSAIDLYGRESKNLLKDLTFVFMAMRTTMHSLTADVTSVSDQRSGKPV